MGQLIDDEQIMFIQTQDTPNPQTLKFIPGVVVMASGTQTFSKKENLGNSKLADMILAIDGVDSVFLAEDFISITKDENASWDSLKPHLLTSMIDFFVKGESIISPIGDEKKQDSHIGNEIVKQIKEIIETRVQPAVAQDGGSIIFKDFADGIVYVELQGACSGCPSSTITLKSGIENMLKHYVPEVISVEAI